MATHTLFPGGPMTGSFRSLRHVAAFCATLACLVTVPAASPAQDLQDGDIVIPGVRVIDGFGSTNGCFYRLRGGGVTRLYETSAFRAPRDMVVDSQGRLVFFASPASRNIYDTALFRIDPASGALERLFYFPAYVASGDTLPSGAGLATNFSGASTQSLHLQKGFSVVIDDDQNGGWPQINSGESYGFSMTTTVPSGNAPTNYQYDPADGQCREGVWTGLLPWTGAPHMAGDGSKIYYGLHSIIGRTGAASRVELHLDGNWGHFDASAIVPPKNELVITGHVFDNTRYPNGVVDCGSANDSDVPFAPGGSSFQVLSMDGLGVLDGSLYATSPSGATGTPFVFDIAPRPPYLNPYACIWDTAIKGAGMLDFNLPDGTPTSAPLNSPDGGALIGLGNGVVKRVDAAGNFEILDSSQPYSGRPWRWHGAASPSLAAATAAADSGAQVLVVRADALVHVLLTDDQGRSIGHDADGNAVNDFGGSGELLALGAGGWPRLIVLRDPPNGTLSADIAATGAGDWSVKAYLAHEAGGGMVTTTAGSAGGAGSVTRGLHVGQPTQLTWYASPLGVGDAGGTQGAGLLSVGPVPSRGEVRLAYRVPGGGARVRLEVFDVAGRLVATPVNGFANGGTYTLAWRGERATGARLAHGIYLACLSVNGRRETRRIVLTN